MLCFNSKTAGYINNGCWYAKYKHPDTPDHWLVSNGHHADGCYQKYSYTYTKHHVDGYAADVLILIAVILFWHFGVFYYYDYISLDLHSDK